MPSESEMKNWLRLAYDRARNSPEATQVGAVVVGGDGALHESGWNDRLGDPAVRTDHKSWLEHAERQAIYSCAAYGLECDGATMYAPWASCPACARAIALSGIVLLVRHRKIMDITPARWQHAIRFGDKILRAEGVEIVEVEGDLGDCDPIRFAGEVFLP